MNWGRTMLLPITTRRAAPYRCDIGTIEAKSTCIRKFAAFSGLAALLAMSGFANAQSGLNASPLGQACLEPSNTIETIIGELEIEDWQLAPDPSALTLEQLAWTGMPQYFAGDSGGAELKSVLELKIRTAKGLLRKKELPTNKTRILVRKIDERQETLLLMWRKPTPQTTEIQCLAALVNKIGNEPLVTGDAVKIEPDFHRMSTPNLPQNEATQKVDVVVLNRISLEERLGAPVPADFIVETYLSYSAKEN